MPSEDVGKSKPTGVRIPIDLFDRLEHVKSKQAHKRVPNSELFIEAIRLYVEMAEKYGLDEDLRPKCPKTETDAPKKPHPLRRPQSA